MQEGEIVGCETVNSLTSCETSSFWRKKTFVLFDQDGTLKKLGPPGFCTSVRLKPSTQKRSLYRLCVL
jgi:hypothetical protein